MKTIRNQFTHPRVTIIKVQKITSVDGNVENPHILLVELQNSTAFSENSLAVPQTLNIELPLQSTPR